METHSITLPLIPRETANGVNIFDDIQTKTVFFSKSSDPKNMVKCPDGQSAFKEIVVYALAIICKMPNTDTDAYRIFLRKTGTWLIHPETIDELNFDTVLSVTSEFIHLYLIEKEGSEDVRLKRVYSIRYEKWLEIPDWDLGAPRPIKSFESISISQFQNRDCLILKQEKAKNPLSIFFLDSGEYYSIPNPREENAKGKDHGCAIFYQLFQRYVVIAFGDGMSNNIKSFNIWSSTEKCFIEINGTKIFLEQCVVFSEDHIGFVKDAESMHNAYEIISTKTWKLIEPIEFTYVTKRSTFNSVWIDSGGVMRVSIAIPQIISIEL